MSSAWRYRVRESLAWPGPGDLREDLEKQEPQEWSQAGATLPRHFKLISLAVAGGAFEDLRAVLPTLMR